MKEQEPNRTEQLRLFIVGEILSGAVRTRREAAV